MEKDEAKAKILKGVSRKLKRRATIIAGVSAAVVVTVGAAAYYMLFVRQTPVPAEDYVAAVGGAVSESGEDKMPSCKYASETDRTVINAPCKSEAGDMVGEGSGGNVVPSEVGKVRAYTKRQTINQLDDRELAYNQVVLPIRDNMLASLNDNWHTHVENSADGTAALYFYMSENIVYKSGWYSTGLYVGEMDTLFGWHLCDTCAEGEVIAPITRIYYLVHDYDNFKQAEFDKAKGKAVLLWKK